MWKVEHQPLVSAMWLVLALLPWKKVSVNILTQNLNMVLHAILSLALQNRRNREGVPPALPLNNCIKCEHRHTAKLSLHQIL